MLHSHYELAAHDNVTGSRWVVPERRARRRRVLSKNITYSQLMAVMAKRAGQPNLPSQASLGNARAALNVFLRERGLRLDARVGSTLRDAFPDVLLAHRGELEKAGLTAPTINNKAASLKQWHNLVVALDTECADETGSRTPFQLKLDELYASRSDMARLLRKTGLNRGMMWRWLKKGVLPNYRTLPRLAALVRLCGQDPNTLIDLLPINHRFTKSALPPEPENKYRAEQKKKQSREFRFSAKTAPEAFKQDWRALVEHKVAIAKFVNDTGGAGASIKAQVRGALDSNTSENGSGWRVRPRDEYVSRFPHWVDGAGDQVVPTAGLNFTNIATFLGWAHLPKEENGAGIAKEHLSLALLADYTLIDKFTEWRAVESNGVNTSVLNFLMLAAMMCRPETGFLWHHSEIGARAGVADAATWRAQCADTTSKCKKAKLKLTPLKTQTRKPELPLKALLDLPRPLAGFRQGIRNLAACRPRNPRDAATRARNLALLAVSSSNPLRLTNLRMLTYREDNSGHFRRAPDGTWWIFVPSVEFKNVRGAAKDNDYHRPLSPLAAQYLSDYLENYRHRFGASDRGLVFVSWSHPNRPWIGLPERYATLTRSFMPGNTSFRTHGVRHLVGTSILMATHGNVQIAALALHDETATVEKHYKDLLATYAARGINAAIGIDMTVDDEMSLLLADPLKKPD